jgi:hypothetical protein
MMTSTQAIVLLEEAKKCKKFTEWEEVFTKNILRIRTLKPLSMKQEAIVLRIYAAKTGAGEKEYHQYSTK